MIELSRYITIGQFVDTDSVIHRLDGRTKLICGILFIILFSFLSSFAAFGIAFLFALLLIPLSRLSFRFVANSLKPAVIFVVIIFIFQVFFFQTQPTAHIFWQWHFLSISHEGIVTSLLADIRAIFLFFIVLVITFTTSLMDIADATDVLIKPLQKLKLPTHELIMVLIIALKFVPLFIKQLENLMRARITRNIHTDTKNIIKRTYNMTSLLVPLFIHGFRRADMLAVAMEARCYRGGKNRTKLRTLSLHTNDFIAFGVCIILTIIFIVIH